MRLKLILGDSGSGFLHKDGHSNQWTIYGVVSRGIQTNTGCAPHNYVVFVSVSKYLDWILDGVSDGEVNLVLFGNFEVRILFSFSASFPTEFSTHYVTGTVMKKWWWSWFENVHVFYLDSTTIIDNINYPIKFERNLKVKSLQTKNNQKIEFLPILVDEKFPNLVVYKVKNCNVQKVVNENFNNLNKLEILELPANKIDHIAENSFKSLVNLKILNLNNNKLQNLYPNWIESCRKLKEIHLNGNLLTSLNERHFSNNKVLTEIHLAENQISKLSPLIFDELRVLNYVDFTSNACLETYYSGEKINRLEAEIREKCN